MKQVMFAVPVAVLCAGAALAQTETTTQGDASGTATAGATGEMFGTSWPLSVGTTFFTGADSATLRSADELAKGWQSLSPEDQTMIRTDCEAFLAAHADEAAPTEGGATAEAGATAPATGTAGSESGTAATVPAGYNLAEMQAICGAVGTF